MIINDHELTKIINNKELVKIKNDNFEVRVNPKGSCDGCYFIDKTCPPRATNICTSNGGNILVLKK